MTPDGTAAAAAPGGDPGAAEAAPGGAREGEPIRLASSLAEIGPAVDALMARLQTEGAAPRPTPDECDAIRLGVTEALNNSVIHGHGERPGGAIALDLRRGDGVVRVDIEDRAPPLPAETVRRLSAHGAEAPEGALPEGGWGIFLIRQSASGVAYERIGERNRLSLFFALSADAPDEAAAAPPPDPAARGPGPPGGDAPGSPSAEPPAARDSAAAPAGRAARGAGGRRRLVTLRRLGALLAIAVGVGVLALEQLAMVSANAMVNAQVSTLRAPIAGRVALAAGEIGARVRPGQTLATIENPRADRGRLDDLALEIADMRARIGRLDAEAAAIGRAVSGLRRRMEAYRAAFAEMAAARVASAEAGLAASRARLGAAAERRRRSERLLEAGHRTPAAHERVAAEASVARAERDAAAKRLERARIAAVAADAGIHVAGGAEDAPFSTRRIGVLETERARIEAERAYLEDRLAALEERRAAERMRVDARRSAAVGANADGRLWERVATDGEDVVAGQPLLRLVDCRSSVVTLSVTESVYNRLAVGDPARFRLDGHDRVFDATVLRLAGSGAREVYEGLAVAPSRRHLERFDAALSVPGLRAHPGLGCAVGRTGRAFFDERPLDRLRALLP